MVRRPAGNYNQSDGRRPADVLNLSVDRRPADTDNLHVGIRPRGQNYLPDGNIPADIPRSNNNRPIDYHYQFTNQTKDTSRNREGGRDNGQKLIIIETGTGMNFMMPIHILGVIWHTKESLLGQGLDTDNIGIKVGLLVETVLRIQKGIAIITDIDYITDIETDLMREIILKIQ